MKIIWRTAAAMRAILTDLLGVDSCPVCGGELSSAECAMCLNCLSMLPRTYSWLAHDHGVLADVTANGPAPPGFSAAWFEYDTSKPWAELVRRAKYGDNPRLARNLGRMFAQELVEAVPDVADRLDLLLPVPMHWRKRMTRGFNQSEEIARGIADVLHTPLCDALYAVKAHDSQTHKGARARKLNIAGTLSAAGIEHLDGYRIAVVDDVITTGATMRECFVALGLAGAKPASISALALAATARRW